MCVVGLDIGESFAVAAALDCFPENILQYFDQYEKEIIKLKPDKDGAQKLLDMKPTAIILEPTGFWYSSFWYNLAKLHNIEVYWVGHCDLSSKRNSYGFTNKSDYSDALCLAALYFDKVFIDRYGNKRFLKNYLAEEVLQLRSLFFACEQLDKIRNAMINQFRQRLSSEFPEAAAYTFSRQGKYDYSPALGWFAGIRSHRWLEKLWNESQSKAMGLKISQYTRDHALSIIEIERRLTQCEQELDLQLDRECFSFYIQVFDLFGFGRTLKSLLLLNSYPFDRFLLNGKPERTKRKSKEKDSQKMVTVHRSLRRFQAFMGMSYSKEESGTSKNSKKFHGSGIIRNHLYAFIFARVIPNGKRHAQTPLIEDLHKEYKKMRERGIHGKDAMIRVEFIMTRLLFNELWKQYNEHQVNITRLELELLIE